MTFNPGDTVKILDGKLKGTTGQVRYVDPAGGRYCLVVTPELDPFDVRVPCISLTKVGGQP